MKKCDFCTSSTPNSGCPYYNLPIHRRIECEKAIEKMTKALNKQGSRKRNKLF